MERESLTADEIEGRVLRVIADTQKIDLDKITPSSTFEELGIDSFDGINILFALETEFKVEIPDQEAQNLRSVAQAVQGVRSLLEKGQIPELS